MADQRSGNRRYDAIVIGAGVAGVTAARALAQGDWSVVVLESGDRVGGRVHSIRDFASAPLEAGAEFIHGSGAAIWGDVKAAGLCTIPVPYKWSWFNIAHSTRWLPVHLMHPGVWRSFDILWSLGHLKGGDRSAAQFIADKGYQGRARDMAALALTAHLPGSIDEVGVEGLGADGVLNLEDGLNHRVLDGYDLLPAHIATGLDIRHGFRVAKVNWSPDGVSVTSTTGETVEARGAVTTLPHGVLASGRVDFDPVLPDPKRAAIERISSGPVGRVIMSFDEQFWPERMTQLVCAEGPVTLYWAPSYGTDGPPVLTAYSTGPRAAKLFAAGPDDAIAKVLDDLDRVYPKVQPRRFFRDARVVDWATDPNALGGYTFLPPGAVGARADLAVPSTGALFWAGSATAWHPVADTVEAAYLSGLRAARQASAHIRRDA